MTPEVIDFEKLLAPMDEENPCGPDMRGDSSPGSPYYTVKDKRDTVRRAERELEMSEDGEGGDAAPDWKGLLDEGLQYLSKHSKDLEIAAFVGESLVHVHGFAGARDGFRLARELMNQYWEHLHPNSENGDVGERIWPVAVLTAETLVDAIKRITLVPTDDGRYAFYHYDQAFKLGQITDPAVRSKRIAEGTVSLDQLKAAVNKAPTETLLKLLDDIKASKQEYESLTKLVDEKGGAQAPPTTPVHDALNACEQALLAVGKEKLKPPQEENEATEDTKDEKEQTSAGSKGPIRNKEEALERLLEISDFFYRIEPSSPVSLALKQAVRWGRMDYQQLVKEFITDDAFRKKIYERVGIQEAKSE